MRGIAFIIIGLLVAAIVIGHVSDAEAGPRGGMKPKSNIANLDLGSGR